MGEAKQRGSFEERKAQAIKEGRAIDAKFKEVKRGVWANIPWPLRVLILAGLWFVFSYGLPK